MLNHKTTIKNTVEYHFVKQHHKMQETRNNCFGSEKCSSTLSQAKTGKLLLTCLPLAATLLLHFGTRAYLFYPDEGSCYLFPTRNNCCEFLASYVVIFQIVIKSYFSQLISLNHTSYPYNLIKDL